MFSAYKCFLTHGEQTLTVVFLFSEYLYADANNDLNIRLTVSVL